MSGRRSRPSVALALWLTLVCSVTAGCVRIYQPMSGLHRPAVVDPQAANFEDLRLTVHCVPGGLLSRGDASSLCRKVGTLFENQGAQVTIIDTVGRSDAIEEGLTEEAGEESSEPQTDLTLELRARKLHEATHPLSWVLCIGTLTLLPGITEATFAQDVSIRDGNGFLLVSDSLEGRMVERFGGGPWVGNWLLDVVWRDKEDRLTGGAADRDLSADLYQQLSQLTFNAKMQWQVLRESEASVDASRVP